MTPKEAFWKLHEDLPRQGPGSIQTSDHLFSIATKNKVPATAIDMGCGTGVGALYLAHKGVQVLAIDTNESYLQKLHTLAHEQHMESLIITKHASMDDVSSLDTVDLIWAEGTMYIIGWEKALTVWSQLLMPGGIIVATDCFWLTDKPSSRAAKFWEADPNMMDLEQAKQLIQRCGFDVLDTYVQPDSDWFDPYYIPLQSNIDKNSSSTDPTMIEMLQITQEEIDVRRECGNEYGHVGFVMKKR